MGCLLPAVVTVGAAKCLLLLGSGGPTLGRRYAFDLLGAAAGAMLAVPLLSVIPTPELAAGIGALPLFAYTLLGGSRRVALGLLLALGTLLGWGAPLRLRHVKYYEETAADTTPIYERSTPT